MWSAKTSDVVSSDYFGRGLPTFGQINAELSRHNGYVVTNLKQKVLLLSDRLVLAYAGKVGAAMEVAETLGSLAKQSGLEGKHIDHLLKGFGNMYPNPGDISLLALLQEAPNLCYYSGLNCFGRCLENGTWLRFAGSGHLDVDKVLGSIRDVKDATGDGRQGGASRIGYGTAISLVAALYQHEQITGRGLEARYGGAYELAFLNAGVFSKLDSVCWVFWDAQIGDHGRVQMILRRVLVQGYRNDRLLVRVLNGDLSKPALSEYTISNPLLHPEGEDMAGELNLSTEWQVHSFLVRHPKRTDELRLRIVRKEDRGGHLLKLDESNGSIELQADISHLADSIR